MDAVSSEKQPHSAEEDEEESSAKKTKRGKGKAGVASSWSLRSKKSWKPVEEEEEEKKKKRETKTKSRKENSVNEFSRIKTHLRYLLHRIKYEQSLIDAYSAEGWKGQSLEKLKPEKELDRAKSHISRYKLKIRSLVQHLDHLLSFGKLPGSLFDSKGEIDSEDIFCAKCGSKDLTPDNDIILCDGACERGFHQYCLEPPLVKVPPGEESWICPGCDCKLYCIDMLKDYHSHKVSLTDTWESIFPEAAAGASSGNNLTTAVSGTSDESKEGDEDYDPGKPETSEKKVNGDSNSSEYFSAPDDSIHEDGVLPSEDSEDDDFDPHENDDDEKARASSGKTGSGSDFSSDSEDLEAVLKDGAATMDVDSGPPSKNEQFSTLKDELSHLTASEPVSGKRSVPRLDYQKLHQEAYQNSSSESTDEDFEVTSIAKKKRISYPETSGELSSQSGRGRLKKLPYKRLGEATTQKLHQSFLQNMYPERSVKEKLATELGITIRQVTKWFENARWSYHHHGQPKQQNQPGTSAQTGVVDSEEAAPAEETGKN